MVPGPYITYIRSGDRGVTPLRIEAVYERVPIAPPGLVPAPGDPAHVRWGFRATLDAAERPRATQDVPPRTAPLALVPRAAAPAPRVERAAARPDREGADPAPFPELLGYGPLGQAIPLRAGHYGATDRGVGLDILA